MILEIHEITPKILDLLDKPEAFYGVDLLTFDDGLYSQFYYKDYFNHLNIHRIYFISSSIICPENSKQVVDVPCHIAHQKFFDTGDAAAYMKWSQIRELQNDGFEIGSHNHNHSYFADFTDFKKNLDLSLKIFKENDIIISNYCAPYNHRFLLGDCYVTKLGLRNIMNRVRIEELEELWNTKRCNPLGI